MPLTGYPTPGHEEAAAPLGRPAPVSVMSAAYAFMDKDDSGHPVRYDPCRPIHYVTRAANSPAAGPELIQQAIADVSRATGLVFIDDGPTTEAPSDEREPYQPDRYGDRWAPVLIAWETTAEEPRFTNPDEGYTILGIGGSEDVSIGDTDFTYVSGQLKLNAPGLHSIIEDEGPAQARGTIEHELGHLVGLDHVKDPTQLMNPTDSAGLNSYQAGDLAGLAILGQGECRPGI
ncbi:peptidase [Arthrobacter oryzae]|uniref:peptidase n=1 Tax=Arthrobacter oryzae TaxID=409290 RepID=UPI000EADB381|nr:peptidase [Arthrobacter oryzae]